MQLRTAKDFGAFAKGQRRAAGLSQAELGRRIGATRQWVISFEAGKPTVELALVLETLRVLGATLDAAVPSDTRPAPPDAATPYDTLDIPDPGDVLARVRLPWPGTPG